MTQFSQFCSACFAENSKKLTLFLILFLATFGACAQTVQLFSFGPGTLDTGTFGLPDPEQAISPQITLTGATPLAGPTTLSFTLPAHVSYAGFTTTNPGGWSCTGAAQSATCTWSLTLTSTNPNTSSMSVMISVANTLPVPGNSDIQITVNNAALPAPDTANCTLGGAQGTSQNRCLRLNSTHRQSQIFPNAALTSSSPIFEVGQEAQFSFGFRNIGYGLNNGQVTAKVYLPVGFEFVRTQSAIPVWSCTPSAVTASGQLITCTLPSLFDGATSSNATFTVVVNVTAAVAIPGPVPIIVTIENSQQPAPISTTCSTVPIPLGCGYYTVPTRAAQISQMDILAITHSPATFVSGTAGNVVVNFANIGNAAAGAMTLRMQAPIGFAFVQSMAAIPAGTCSASGTAASSQIVTCNFPTGSGAGANGNITLVFNPNNATLSPARVYASIGDVTNVGPNLATCSATPNAIGCGERIMDVSTWLFCDGYEVSPLACGMPP